MGKRRVYPGRRVHLILSEEVWGAVCAEATRRRARFSCVVQSVLTDALLTGRLWAEPQPGDVPHGRRHDLRIAVDMPLWVTLKAEASKYRVSVPYVVREALRALFLPSDRERECPKPGVIERPARLRTLPVSADTDTGTVHMGGASAGPGVEPIPLFDLSS